MSAENDERNVVPQNPAQAAEAEGKEGGQQDKPKVVDEVLKIFNHNWNRQVILYGPPGTSKTYSARTIAARFLRNYYEELLEKEDRPADPEHTLNAIEEYLTDPAHKNQDSPDYGPDEGFLQLMEEMNLLKIIQFHPSYSYEDFVRGISMKQPDGKGTNAFPSYEVESKILEKFCEDMFNDDGTENEKRKVLIIDEINRAPLASVLGELIFGLEYRGEPIDTPYELKDKKNPEKNKTLIIPKNLYIIGTMNTADRSIGSIDYAVRRRFAFVNVPSEPSAIEGTWENIGKDTAALYNALMNPKNGIFKDDLKSDPELDMEDIRIGQTYFMGQGNTESNEMKEKDEIAYLCYRLEYQIWPIYQEYIKDGLIRPEGKEVFRKQVESFRDDHEDNPNYKKNLTEVLQRIFPHSEP